MAFAVQTVFYGCAALALWVWADMHAVDIEREQRIERWQQESDERNCRIDQRESRLEAMERVGLEAEARLGHQKQTLYKRKMQQLRDEQEQRRQEAKDNYNKAWKEMREQLNHAKTTIPDEAKYRELDRVKKEIAACAKDYGVLLTDLRYDKDGDRVIIKPKKGDHCLPSEFQERANRLLDNDDVREIYNHYDPIRQTLKGAKQATEALRWEFTNIIP